ncbi:MAG: exo-alpha-sialidase [Opitutaceae bacterium]|nr:exo-alpha-sialidase [Opitutaceae bacterium]
MAKLPSLHAAAFNSSRRSPPLCPRFRTGCLLAAVSLLAGVSYAGERDAVHLSAIPEFAAENWEALPRLHPAVVSIFEAKENVAGYNMHPAMAHCDGMFWAMWSSGAWGEDMPGQKVRFASSVDGLRWSESAVLAEPDPEFMLTPTGFWVRDGELLAMACHRRGKPVVDGKRQKVVGRLDHTLRIYRYDVARRAWDRVGAIPDTFNDKPVERLSNGDWAMIRNTQAGNRFFAVGGTKAIDAWEFFPIPAPGDNHKMAESHLYELPDGAFSLLFRDNSRSNFLYRAFSEDRGRTWTNPVRTNFRDQTAKFSVLR